MSKSESKFHNTAAKMQNALLSLLESKDFTEITIAELCDKASVNRSTFYSHYDNTYDLLKETQDCLIENFFQSYVTEEESLQDLRSGKNEYVSAKFIMPYLQFIKKNKTIFKVYMANLNHFNSDEISEFLINKIFANEYKQSGITDETLMQYISTFFMTGITSIIMKWVNRDCCDDMSFICEIILSCVRPNAHH